MLNLSSIIARGDISLLQDLFGPETIRLVKAVKGEYFSFNDLKDLVIETIGVETILTDTKCRNLIFDLLKPEEVSKILSIIGKGLEQGDPYEAIKQIRFPKNSERKSLLFAVFGLNMSQTTNEDSVTSISAIHPSYVMFDYQRKACVGLKQYLNAYPYRVLLHMPTGSGKTRTAMNFIADYFREHESATVLWLANSEELCDQAFEEFEKAWSFIGNRNLKCVRFWGAHDFSEDFSDRFIVASLQKMYSRILNDSSFLCEIGNHLSLLIMDEAHQAIAESYQTILELFTARKKGIPLLGLSATPGRSWNNREEDERLAKFFGKNKVSMNIEGFDNPVDYLVNEGYLAKARFVTIKSICSEQLTEKEQLYLQKYLDLPDSFLKRIGIDETRNLKILVEIKHLIKRHLRIILFAPSVQCAEILNITLNAIGIRSYCVTSKTHGELRKNSIEMFKSSLSEPIVLCNYGILTTGFDAPKTSCAVIARPTLSLVLYSQMVGRCIRGIRAGGNLEAEVVTVVDASIPGFGSVAEAFSNWNNVWNNLTVNNN